MSRTRRQAGRPLDISVGWARGALTPDWDELWQRILADVLADQIACSGADAFQETEQSDELARSPNHEE